MLRVTELAKRTKRADFVAFERPQLFFKLQGISEANGLKVFA